MERELQIKEDERGKLVEIYKIPGAGQVIYSTSKPGVVRGNHYHTRKREYFCIIEGKGKISLRDRATGEKEEHVVTGENPEVIEMPLNWTHNVQNIGDSEMKMLVWANEIFDPNDPDTFKEEV